MGDPLRVGLIGVGRISGAYLDTLPRLENLRLTVVGDLDQARAESVAAAHDGVVAVAVDQLYRRDDVDLVLNLTVPEAHAKVALAAIAAGKHVYNEKPLAAATADAREVMDAAVSAGVRVGCAPDTVLGTGIQTARAALDAGEIGAPFAATAFMTTPGHEWWHPAPEFYYRSGGGPLLDMGPYYLTSLVTLLGPVRRVVGMASTPQAHRVIGEGPRAGTRFPVEVATHVTGVLEHTNGALSTLVMSFETWAAQLPSIEIYGREGSLSVPDPNLFAGEVTIHRSGDQAWAPVPEAAGYAEGARGYGIADMARAITDGTPHRCAADLAYHVLEVMESLLVAAETGAAVEITSRCERPSPVPIGVSPDVG